MSAHSMPLQPRCPSCGADLRRDEAARTDDGDEVATVVRYQCPGRCRSPETGDALDVIACPACGSTDTAPGWRTDGHADIACNSCGALVTAATPVRWPNGA